MDQVAAALAHARYLAGCQNGEGEFATEPEPSRAEWSNLIRLLDAAIEEMEDE